MNFQAWDASATSNMFNSNSLTTSFPANISSYFRRPAKVVKPSSRNHSPRNTSRRRMTTTGYFPSRTRSVSDHQRISMPQMSQFQQQSSRPISWHPNSMEDNNQLQVPLQGFSEGFLATPYAAAEVNGLVTPMSHPVIDEPQIQELISPLEELSANDRTNYYSAEHDFTVNEYWADQQYQMKQPQFNVDHDILYPMAGYPSWYLNSQYQTPNVITAPASPKYFPTLGFDASVVNPEPHSEIGEKEELVGMGLYDSPADVQSSSLLFGGDLGASQRKSLKLEDAFVPEANSDDGDNEQSQDTEEDEEDGEEDAPHDPSVDEAVSLTNSPDENILPSTGYSYMIDHNYNHNGVNHNTTNNFMITTQWPAQNQAGYGWI